jgi:hypothetical protein
MDTKKSIAGLTDVAVETVYLCPGENVAAVYENEWCTQCVIAHNNEECDTLVKFMERKDTTF